MTRKLVQTGNSDALILTKEMKEHLGVDSHVDVEFHRGSIVIKKPLSQEDVVERVNKKFGKALKKLAE